MSKKSEVKSDATTDSQVVDTKVVEAPADVKPVYLKSETVTDDTTAKRSTVVDTIFDFGIHWATAGLKLAKTALEETSKALANTAKTLETLAESLSHKQA